MVGSKRNSKSSSLLICMGFHFQGDHLVIANLGDSRAVLGTRSGEKNQICSVQLTVDLKPDTPGRLSTCALKILLEA